MSENTTTTPRKKLSRTDIEGAKDVKTTTVYVPEWGGDVTLRSLDSAGRVTLEKAAVQHPGTKYQYTDVSAAKSTMLSLSIVDADTLEPLFPGEEGTKALDKKSGDVINTLLLETFKLNGLTPSEDKPAVSAEDALGN
jgi:hypothetical protein